MITESTIGSSSWGIISSASAAEKMMLGAGTEGSDTVAIMMFHAYRFLADLVGPPPANPPAIVLKSPRMGIL